MLHPDVLEDQRWPRDIRIDHIDEQRREAMAIDRSPKAPSPGRALVTVDTGEARLAVTVRVAAPLPLDCPAGSTHAGVLSPGVTVEGDPGSPLAAASIALLGGELMPWSRPGP